MPKGQYERKRQPIQDRFEAKVERTDDHWLWTGAITKNGYGKLATGGKRAGWALAHRVAWEIYRGPIPKGLTIDHLCRVRHCVNPDHLEPVTMRVNLHRGEGMRGSQTHCKHGHEFTPENTYIRADGVSRACRICARERDRKRWAKRRATENPKRRERWKQGR